MGLNYNLAYRLGFTPWERAGEGGARQLDRLLDWEEEGRSRPLGRALDIGCGTGAHTFALAERGWAATGLDKVGLALERARAKGDAATFVLGDAATLDGIEPGVELFLDVGCFHGLSDEQRRGMGRAVTRLATPSATVLMVCFVPNHMPLMPRGASARDVTAAFPAWQVDATEPADTAGMPAPLRRRTAPRWFRLARS